MTDDLTAQVREALDSIGPVLQVHGRGLTSSVTDETVQVVYVAVDLLAPRIAAALRAVARDAIERTASDLCSEDLGGWVKQNSPFALAAGLAALRGTEEPHDNHR